MNDSELPAKLVNRFEDINITMGNIYSLAQCLNLDFDFFKEFRFTYQIFSDTMERFLSKEVKSSDLKVLEMTAIQIDMMAQDLLQYCRGKIRYMA